MTRFPISVQVVYNDLPVLYCGPELRGLAWHARRRGNKNGKGTVGGSIRKKVRGGRKNGKECSNQSEAEAA